MNRFLLSSFIIFLFIEISGVLSNHQTFQEEIAENSQLNVPHSSEFQNAPLRVQDGNSHIIFQFHDAIRGLHAYFLNMLSVDARIMRQYETDSNISHQCIRGMMEFSRGLKERRIWALRMFDSWGKVPSGILEGTFESTGDYEQCLNTNIPGIFQGQQCEVGFLQNITFQHKLLTDDMTELIDFSYIHETDQSKIWNFDDKYPNGFYPVTTSVCLPSKCSIEDINILVTKATSEFKKSLKIEVTQCVVKSPWKYTNGQNVGMALILVIIALEVIATVVDIRLNNSQVKNNDSSEKSFLHKTLKCVSLRVHLAQLFQKDTHPESIKIFHGIRVLTTLHVILYHHYMLVTQHSHIRLRQWMKMRTTFVGGLIWFPAIPVDTFFFISGFLVLYSHVRLRKSLSNIFIHVLPRYLKLWLPVVLVYGISIFFFRILEPMAFEIVGNYFIERSTHWWQNALCIHNFNADAFLPWTWTSGADMQLYASSYFILLFYNRNPVKCMNFVKIIIAVALIYLLHHQYSQKWPPYQFDSFSKRGSPLTHWSTQCHIAPYLVGMLTCDILNRKHGVVSKVVKSLGWFLSIVIICIFLLMTYFGNGNRVPSLTEVVLFGGLFRFLWALVIGWITFICLNGDGGILTSFLSWEGFTLFSRLSYMANLVHLFFIYMMIPLLKSCLIYSYSSLISSFLVLSVVSYVSAFFLYLTCEAPSSSLIKQFFKSYKENKAKKMQ